MSKRALILAVVAAVVVVIVSVGAFVFWPRGGTPFTKEDAIDDFRSQISVTTKEVAKRSTTPEPGVYTFAASGREDVKLGVLPTETRPYPATVPMVIVDAPSVDGADCFKVTVNLLAQHGEDTTYCVGGDGSVAIAAHEKRQQIGALHPVAEMTCDPGTIHQPGVETSKLACKLSLAQGPATMSADLAGTSLTTTTTVDLGDETLDAIALDIRYEISGDISGSWHEQLWLAADSSLPLRIERELNLDGLAQFQEHSRLELTSTTPER